MLFQMIDFTVDRNDFFEIGVNMKNKLGTNFTFTSYCLKEPIKLIPTEPIPSFYMVNKYGDVYTETQFHLVPYIRFWIADPYYVYYNNNTRNFDETAEIPRTDYRNNPFHSYWIGAVGIRGVTTPSQPNPNCVYNLKHLMDVYRNPQPTTNKPLTHGLRNDFTPITKLVGIGENLVPNEGGVGYGMFMPAGARYMQASLSGDYSSVENGYILQQYDEGWFESLTPHYRFTLSLPALSTSANNPFILPPLFTDLFSVFCDGNQFGSTIYGPERSGGAAIAVLTFGVQPA